VHESILKTFASSKKNTPPTDVLKSQLTANHQPLNWKMTSLKDPSSPGFTKIS